tara:strand:- start:622 stop:1170 length:549 start_codon:yes stop_codon:yes gene_type:complete
MAADEDFAWHERGLCFAGDHPADVDFFSDDKVLTANAVAYCKGDYYPDGEACPVIKQCLDSSLSPTLRKGDDHGVFGGTTPRERRITKRERLGGLPHGSRWTWTEYGCRCDICVQAARGRQKEIHAKKKAKKAAHRRERTSNSPHGTVSRYTNGACRCDPCRKSMAAATLKRKRRKEAKERI